MKRPKYAGSDFQLDVDATVELVELLGKDFGQFARWCSGWGGEVLSAGDPKTRTCLMGHDSNNNDPRHRITVGLDPQHVGLERIQEVVDEISGAPTRSWFDAVAFLDLAAYRVFEDGGQSWTWMGFNNGPPSLEDGPTVYFYWGRLPQLPSYFRVRTREKFLQDWYARERPIGFKTQPPKPVAVTPRVARLGGR